MSTFSRRAFLRMVSVAGAAVVVPRGIFAEDVTTTSAKASVGAKKKVVIAHRGASAYAPENSLEAYRLAIKQGAEYVEQDLQITKDGVLVCCHDATLQKLTDVEQVFPDRFKEEKVKGEMVKQYYLNDFTLEELKKLDYGVHLAPKYKGVRIPTWQEAIDEIGDKAGLAPETKSPEFYAKRGFNIEQLTVDALKKNGLDKADAGTPVILQSFSKPGVKSMRAMLPKPFPILQLSESGTKWTVEMLDEVREFATGISPFKKDVTRDIVKQAHERGMIVVPYTFRASDPKPFKNVKEEMRHYLQELDVDMLFTDNPDLFPR